MGSLSAPSASGVSSGVTPGDDLRVFFGSASANAPGSYNMSGVASPEIDALIDKGRAQEKTQRILARLPEAYGLVLLWRYWEEHSTKEMAAQTGKTEKAMERLLARARVHFRRLWEGEGP